MKKVVVTGDRPTGRLHLGHFFGSLANRIDMQDDYDSYILIADVQALTDNFDNPEKVRNNVKELVLDYLAVGLDPEKVHIYIQSMIPEIAELTVYFSNLVTVNRLYRNPTTKAEVSQKSSVFGSNGESITYGFLGYPVSQAADIAALDGEVVPVGEDQLPHIEQAREIVRKFNAIYGETFKEPQAKLSKNARIKGLDGNDKMGKSLGNAIYIADSEEEISKKIMSAVTDPSKIKKDDPANPDVCMVYYYHKLVNQDNLESICNECKRGERGCVQCKKELTKAMMNFLHPMQERRKYYSEHEDLIETILKKGTNDAKKQAKSVMERVRKNMKLDYYSNDDK